MRARDHLKAFDDGIGGYFDSKPHRRVIEHDPHSDVRFWRNLIVKEPPKDFPLMIGDCVQNARASLDYIAWELACAEHGRGNRATQFPIWESRLDRIGSPRPPINLVPPIRSNPALNSLDTAQPYHRPHAPETHPLAVIHRLARYDKHRQLRTTKGQFQDIRVDLIDPASGIIVNTLYQPGIVRDGDRVCLHTIDDFRGVEDAKADFHGAFFVAFEESGPWGDGPILELLRGILDYIEDIVIPKFDPLF